MIRIATHEDIPAMVAMGRDFHEAAGWSDISDFVEENCAHTLGNMIENEAAIILVAEDASVIVGMAGGVTTPIYFNYGHRSGQELFFWMQPDARKGEGALLLAALENEAKALGCESWVMLSLENIRPTATGALYKRRGYRLAEHNWIKRL